MTAEPSDLVEIIARHEREILELRRRVQALQEGFARDQLEANIKQRMAELDAEIKLQELQEEIAADAQRRRHRRGFFRRG